MAKGRQNPLMILDWKKVVAADGCIFDFAHLQAVKIHDQDLSGFIDEWDHALLGMKSAPDNSILLSPFKARVEKHRGMAVDIG